MHFARKFRSAQFPLWAAHYFPYEALKRKFKAACGKKVLRRETPDLAAIHEELDEQCRRVNAFYSSVFSSLDRLKSEALETFGAQAASCAADDASILHGALSYLIVRVHRLLLFARINAEAVAKILDKLDRAGGPLDSSRKAALVGSSIFVRTECLELLEWSDGFQRTVVPGSRQDSLAPRIESIVTRLSQGEGDASSLRELIILMGYESLCEKSKSNLTLKSSGVEESLPSAVLAKCVESMRHHGHSILNLDSLGRSALHYAAECGWLDAINILLESVSLDDSRRNFDVENAVLLPDKDGSSSLAVAISSGYMDVARRLLSAVRGSIIPGSVLSVAVKSGDSSFFQLLLKSGSDPNSQNEAGQSLLCLAIKLHFEEICRTLVEYKADIKAEDPACERNALSAACVEGLHTVVDLLLAAGADPAKADGSGWTPLEHAAYRGYFKIIAMLEKAVSAAPSKISAKGFGEPFTTAPIVTGVKPPVNVAWLGQQTSHLSSYAWIHLGSIDATKIVDAVQFEATRSDISHLELESTHSLSLCSTDDPDTQFEVDLPLLQNNIDKPWLFRAKDISKVKLSFSLYKLTPLSKKQLIGRGFALLGTLNGGLRLTSESLRREHSVLLQSPETLECVAQVTFSFFWVTPHPPPPSLSNPQPWAYGNRVGGHRGSGKNKIDHKRLQIGENTPQSFLTAVQHGASFLEFDVQVTKDLVPVVYHDFTVAETGTDSPMQTLTLDQFQYLSHAQAPPKQRSSRSNSVGGVDGGYLQPLSERMEHTLFYKINGFKSNTRGHFIHERPCTLEQLFQSVPKDVPLNIELKYPMLFESKDWDMECCAIKTDIFVDKILDVIYRHASGRSLLFSSFSPEICIAFSHKQQVIPVFFLSKTAAPKGELRASGMQQAVHFAKSWGLPGIVMECTPFAKCPRLVQYVKDAGLSCMSFGTLNSDPECAKIQIEAGVDGIIADDVRRISILGNEMQQKSG